MCDEWWRSGANKLALANALSNAEMFASDKDLDLFFHMPWKWSVEWSWFQQHGTMLGFDGSVDSRRTA